MRKEMSSSHVIHSKSTILPVVLVWKKTVYNALSWCSTFCYSLQATGKLLQTWWWTSQFYKYQEFED